MAKLKVSSSGKSHSGPGIFVKLFVGGILVVCAALIVSGLQYLFSPHPSYTERLTAANNACNKVCQDEGTSLEHILSYDNLESYRCQCNQSLAFSAKLTKAIETCKLACSSENRVLDHITRTADSFEQFEKHEQEEQPLDSYACQCKEKPNDPVRSGPDADLEKQYGRESKIALDKSSCLPSRRFKCGTPE